MTFTIGYYQNHWHLTIIVGDSIKLHNKYVGSLEALIALDEWIKKELQNA